jgi:hypothetical protein
LNGWKDSIKTQKGYTQQANTKQPKAKSQKPKAKSQKPKGKYSYTPLHIQPIGWNRLPGIRKSGTGNLLPVPVNPPDPAYRFNCFLSFATKIVSLYLRA